MNQDFLLLYRLTRIFHSTLRLDALTHLVLSAAAAETGGGFRRAILFTVNERTGVVQGMLGVDAAAAQSLLPGLDEEEAWDSPRLDEELIEAQRQTGFNHQVIKMRLLLDQGDNPMVEAYRTDRAVLFPEEAQQSPEIRAMVENLGLGSAAVVPLIGQKHGMGLLVVDLSVAEGDLPAERLRFLELFARQAGSAMENAQLVHRLESTHEDLREAQNRLIEGEKLAVLGEMAAQVAHELKNPLVSIGGFAQRLERLDLGEPKANQYAGIIAREVRRMEKMLENILSFSKKQVICFEICDVKTILGEAIDLEQDHCQRQGIELVQEISSPLPSIIGDCHQLRQVLLNLMVNARQSMVAGGVLTVRLRSGILRGDDAVVLEVEDTGGGISQEVMRNIFNPFFSTQPRGTGLGLSISHRIVAQHLGEIVVVNGEWGAQFIVHLPVQPGSTMQR